MIPQMIVGVWIALGVLIVPANDEVYWQYRYRLDVRLIRAALFVALLWWGGFWQAA